MLFGLLLIAICADPLVCEQAIVNRGDVRVGPPLTQQFQIINQSQSPIDITDVRSTCGCLEPKLGHKQIAPGGKTTLTVEVNTLSQPAGPVNWVTRLQYQHGGESKTLALELRARLIAEVRVEPASVAFSIRQTRSVDVAIQDNRARPFRITGAGTSLPNVKAETLANDQNGIQRIRLTASPEGPSGIQSAFAWFTTDDPAYPQIKIPLTVTVPAKQRVVASPSVIDMSAGESKRIVVRDQEGQAVNIERCEVEGPIKTSIANNGKQTPIVTLASDRNSKDQDAKLTIHIGAPVPQVISIPIIIR